MRVAATEEGEQGIAVAPVRSPLRDVPECEHLPMQLGQA